MKTTVLFIILLASVGSALSGVNDAIVVAKESTSTRYAQLTARAA